MLGEAIAVATGFDLRGANQILSRELYLFGLALLVWGGLRDYCVELRQRAASGARIRKQY